MAHLENIRFDLIRYANCWEDADLLVKALNINTSSRVLSIASAGDNSFSLLTGDPQMVVAVDVSKVQLYLVELKKIAISKLEYHSFLEFCGFHNSNNRLDMYLSFRDLLQNDTKIYWDAHREQINKGIIYNGKFESYFRIFSKYVLPFCHTTKETQTLIQEKTEQAQQCFYEELWNNRRWKFMMRIFFGKLIMGRLGRDPEFLKEVNISVGEYIYNKTGKHLSGKLIQGNCYDDFILFGRFDKNLPHYAREENFQRIKKNIDRMVIYEGLAENASARYGIFTHFNLSNIFEYMNLPLFRSAAEKIIKIGQPGSTLCYWNLMVNRRISEEIPDEVEYLQEQSEALTKTDKCFFYNRFITDQLKA